MGSNQFEIAKKHIKHNTRCFIFVDVLFYRYLILLLLKEKPEGK